MARRGGCIRWGAKCTRWSVTKRAWSRCRPGRILAHARNDRRPLVERWSYDGGVTWTDPLSTGIEGWPAHLLKLRDGRILCAYGRRVEAGGVRAVLSEDGGLTWDLDNEVVLRDDGGYDSSLRGGYGWRSDVGYPVSTQLSDGRVLTAYYITNADRITHTAVTRMGALAAACRGRYSRGQKARCAASAWV